MIDLILLAAGNSRRFHTGSEEKKGNKLLYPWQGRPMCEAALERWSRAAKDCLDGGSVFVVAREPEILELAGRYAMHPVYSPESAQGISWSIRNGIRAAREHAEQTGRRQADRYVFGVTDQPMLTETTIRRFLKAAAGAEYACLSWNREPGNPVSFPARALGELLELEGDCGGKKVLRRHMEECVLVPAEREEELKDIDTPEQMTEAEQTQK